LVSSWKTPLANDGRRHIPDALGVETFDQGAHIAGSNFGCNGFGPGWRGRFPHPFPGFRGWWGSGWYGPVFWPFAYDVLFADLFWPWYYEDAFWAYGYPDLYGAVFWPYGAYGYDDLAGYLAPGPGSNRGVYAAASPSEAASSAAGARLTQARQTEINGQISQACGEDAKRSRAGRSAASSRP
jgi:hypothetical protein